MKSMKAKLLNGDELELEQSGPAINGAWTPRRRQEGHVSGSIYFQGDEILEDDIQSYTWLEGAAWRCGPPR